MWWQVLLNAVIVTDVLATIFAFVVAMGSPKTVNWADCDGKLSGPTIILRCACVVSTCLIISLILSGLTYCFRIRNKEHIRNLVILGTWTPLVVNGFLLYFGLIYKKKMDGGCEISHRAFLYLTAVFCVFHGLVFYASLTWTRLIGE
ncbi:hypothetical protein DM860_008032 [Cuscuta australis]|uniref:Uncharacterized protein n=1 Tax=Cuscuta australis TaxID=267555 RepID=A0A328E0Q0_9ASTE|nr:hypothetical protein DM860_008032 [Cuscuta australis]